MKKGDIVKYKNPMADEIGLTFKVLEVNGDRCIIEAQVGMTFNPQQVVNVSDLEVIKTTDELKAAFRELKAAFRTFGSPEADEMFAIEAEMRKRGEYAWLGYGQQPDDWR